jgi:hypothetical protein
LSACANAKDSISDEQKLDFIMLIKSIAEKPPKKSTAIELALNIKFDKLINKALEKKYLIGTSKDSVTKSIFIKYAELRNAYQLPEGGGFLLFKIKPDACISRDKVFSNLGKGSYDEVLIYRHPAESYKDISGFYNYKYDSVRLSVGFPVDEKTGQHKKDPSTCISTVVYSFNEKM